MRYTYNLGDVTPVIFGGFLVSKKHKEAIFWHEPEFDCEEKPNKGIECFRFSIADDVMDDLNWVKESDWQLIADFADIDNYKELAISKDITDRAYLYETVGRYFGFNNLDGYPEKFTYKELKRMYPRERK